MSIKATIQERMRYRFERFLAKGGASIFISLLAVFVSSFVIIILVRTLIRWLVPETVTMEGDPDANFWHDLWYVFLQMTDPGNMYYDVKESWWVRVATIMAGFTGVIILSMLIAFITTALEKTLYEFRKGRGPVLESDHTLILGWNERVVDIIRELIIANESEDYASVVILADVSKEFMDDNIIKRLPDTKTTHVITSNGNPAMINELRRVNADKAKSVIVLASCSDSASDDKKLLSDTQVIKTIMALITVQGGENSLPIISEVFHQDKRDLVEYFDDENIIALDSWDIMGKLLIQTSLTSGLEMVYNEILSFDGSEIYFHEADWNGVLFRDLPYHFKDGIPLGIYKPNGILTLRPEHEVAMEPGDQILILAEDDSAVKFSKNRLYSQKEFEYTPKQLEKSAKRVLVLGWHHVANIFVAEAEEYLAEGSVFDIMFHEPTPEIEAQVKRLQDRHPEIAIQLHNSSTFSLENLANLDPFSYDNVMILSQDATEQIPDKVDSDTLMILLLLRKIKKQNNIHPDHHTKIITQVLNSENQDIIVQTDVDDFIISNKLITMILAQLSENPLIKLLYDDIFQEDGSEIYVKPAQLYFDNFPVTLQFGDAIAQVHKREEICLGVRYGHLSMDSKQNFGVVLNLEKDETITLTEKDFLVVLAEDEL